uniref:Uncharacterized protein n=1 Tax=Oryza punctata TaxID=4537 RepID=A0A0E0KHR0_ORYPU
MDAAASATSSKPKRDLPRIPPNYVSLRDLQELRRKEGEEEQERLQRQREVEAAEAAAAAAKTEEGRVSSEKSWGGSERSRGWKRWAAVAHRASPPQARTEVAATAKKVDGAIGAMAVAHQDAPPAARAVVAAKKIDGEIGVVSVAHRVAPSPSPQGVARKMDGAVRVLAVAQSEAPHPPPTRGEDAGKKKGGAIRGHAVRKGPDETAATPASAFQGGPKEKWKVAAGTKQPTAPAETANRAAPAEKRKSKGKASGDQSTPPVTSGEPREPAEVASASSRGRDNPASRRNRKKGGVGRSAVSNSPDGKAPQPAPTRNSPDGKAPQPAAISISPGRKSSPAAELSSNRRSGGMLGTNGETKPDPVAEKPPVVEAKSTTPAARIVVGSTRPPSIGGPRRQHAGGQHCGVWVPKVAAPAPSRHSVSVRKNNYRGTPDSS